MIDPKLVSAVLVTKGDHDLSEIITSIEAAGIEDIVVWNNAERENLSCYGRYAGIAEAKNEIIYQQDDDLVAPVAEVLRRYEPVRDRYTLVSNNRIDEEWLLTGIGSVFHRDLADCFDRYIELYGFDADFFRVSDVVFAYQNAYRRLVLPYDNLPWGFDSDRMYHQDDHYSVRIRARHRVFSLPERANG